MLRRTEFSTFGPDCTNKFREKGIGFSVFKSTGSNEYRTKREFSLFGLISMRVCTEIDINFPFIPPKFDK